jgi:WD40 repeat protein
VTTVCFLQDLPILVSGSIDQNLRVWNLDSAKVLWTFNNHTKEVHQVARRPAAEGQPMIASVSEDRTVRLWQPKIGRMVRFAQLDSVPLAVSWLPDGSRVVVAGADGHVRLIDPDTADVTQDIAGIESWTYCLAVHPSDGSLVIGGRNGQLKRIEIQKMPAS